MQPIDRIRITDIQIIDRVFEMEGGYVLNFNNQTFAEFFRDELEVNIDDLRWSAQGGSKAKRLRLYLRLADRKTALDTLTALWQYREATRITHDYAELDPEVLGAFIKIFERLGGKWESETPQPSPKPTPRIEPAAALDLSARLLKLTSLEPQDRGYAFEEFLKEMFSGYGLSARGPFRLVGEQIDGSFQLGEHTYLLEAKWTNRKVDGPILQAFNAKVNEKASWSRGLLVSYSGFTETGLEAFGRSKSIICMDGLDLHQILSDQLDLATVLEAKARCAAERGEYFVSVENLDVLPN